MTDILIVGGSAEARALALRLGARAQVILPAQERRGAPWPVPVSGLALSEAALADLLRARGAVVVDASHPNDWQSSRIAAASARAAGVRILRLERAPWQAGRRDRWVHLRREQDAARHVVPGDRVLLATGRETLARFANLRGVYVYSRQITDHDDPFPLPRGRFLRSAAPFAVAQEIALLRRLRIDWLILRNAGGPGGWPKLEAARRIGLRVGMLDRPRLPEVPVVRDVASALARIETWLG
ncbi:MULTISPECIES: precorrin-6A/cobalt-precorrin-6A reductase [unclassified Marinovum]